MPGLEEQFECNSCAECCRRYPITILPEEARAGAEFLGISLEEFLQRHCRLYLDMFPLNSRENPLVVASGLLPGRILEGMEAMLGKPAEGSYLVLPMIAFKKPEYCAFLDLSSKKCKIHPVKPEQCRLFPFISIKPSPDFRQLYQFCQGLQKMGNAKGSGTYGMKHYDSVRNHFEGIKKNGFSHYWPALPESGVALLEGRIVCEISREEFEKAIETFK